MKPTRSSTFKLVVVIDDDPLVLEATRGLLSSWGYMVVTAPSCDDALTRLAEVGRRPDLIICDYRLSAGVGGCEGYGRDLWFAKCLRDSRFADQRRRRLAAKRRRRRRLSSAAQAGRCGDIPGGPDTCVHGAA
jgi:DNA-binding NarL/FixJ family response regulator